MDAYTGLQEAAAQLDQTATELEHKARIFGSVPEDYRQKQCSLMEQAVAALTERIHELATAA